MKKYKWGILAPGKIAATFARGLKLLDNAELWAVGSRDEKRAEEFAAEFGFKKWYGSYEEFAADPELEVVYVASPHSHHMEHTLLCLNNGKNVLCEKAFALNTREVEVMINTAKGRNLFLMEALWPPFQPFYKKAFELLASGVLGEIVHTHGWFSFDAPFDRDERKFNLSLGGSSLLDIGIYPIIDTLTFMGIPSDIKASATFSPTGSEDSVFGIFSYHDGKMASIYSSFRTRTGNGTDFYCEKGNMTIFRGLDMNQKVTLNLHGEKNQEFSYLPPAMGYHWEAEEVMKCLDEGLTESKIVPLSFSHNLMKTLDRVRNSSGIVFPEEINKEILPAH